MPNLAIGLCIGLAAWTICMGSTALSVGSGTKETKILPSFRSKSFTDSRNVKQKNQELPCIGSLFSEIEWNSNGSGMEALKNQNVEGCLTIWWEKETYEGERWRASWNLLLGMRDDKYGIILSQNIQTKNGKLILDSSFYNLNKKSNKWSLISEDVYHRDENQKEIKKEEVDNKILLPNNETIKKSERWFFDFYTGNICSQTNPCTSDSPVNKYSNSIWNFVHESENGGTNLINKWFRDVDKFEYDVRIRLLNVKGSFELATLN